jgi:hypothetical protein
MTWLRALSLTGVVLAALVSFAQAGAQESTTTPTPTSIATPTPIVDVLDATFPVGFDDPVIQWEPVTGAAEFRLTATVWADRINRDDRFCTSPLEPGRRTLRIDKTLDGETTEYHLRLPDLPPVDAWFIRHTQAKLHALREDGEVIAAAEVSASPPAVYSLCVVPRITLPPTGSGPGESTPVVPAAIAGGVAAAGLVAFATLRGLRRERAP